LFWYSRSITTDFDDAVTERLAYTTAHKLEVYISAMNCDVLCHFAGPDNQNSMCSVNDQDTEKAIFIIYLFYRLTKTFQS